MNTTNNWELIRLAVTALLSSIAGLMVGWFNFRVASKRVGLDEKTAGDKRDHIRKGDYRSDFLELNRRMETFILIQEKRITELEEKYANCERMHMRDQETIELLREEILILQKREGQLRYELESLKQNYEDRS